MLIAGKNATWRKMLLVSTCLLAFFGISGAAAQAADPYTVESDIAFGPANDQPGSNLLDIYVPTAESEKPRPVFVWIHGGGWFTGDKVSSTMPFKAKTLVNAGFIFVSVNYRLSPELSGPLALSKNRLRFPTHYLDAARALGWVSKNIGKYGGDKSEMLIGGDSAGGQISTLLATKPAYLKARGMSTRQIKGIFSLDSVGFDVNRMMTPAYKRINAGFQKMMFNAFGTPAEEKRKPYWSSASPIRFADRSDPPIYFVVPTTSPDRWVDAKKMSAKLGQRLGLVSHRVRTEHAGVVPLLGNPAGDMGVTRPLMRFARAAINRIGSVPVIRGDRIVPATGPARRGTVRLQISAKPAARLIMCRIDNQKPTLCPRSWKLETGLHKLQVATFDSTGRATTAVTVNLRVTR